MNIIFMKKMGTVTGKVKAIAIATSVCVATVATTVVAHADGLDPSITAGFTTAGADILLIVAAGVAASVGVIAAAGGAKAGLKWIKGVFAKAS